MPQPRLLLLAATCCFAAAVLPTGTPVKIRVASSGKQLHADDLGDSRLSTRSQTDDPWSRFVFERVATAAANAGGGDGSAGTMRIRVDADLRMLAATPELVSNATQDGGPEERFSLEPADRGYRIRSAATQMYWAVGRTAAGFVSATAADAASGTVFTIAPVPGGACKADADCNYNGVCAVNADANANANANANAHTNTAANANGTCRCDPQWRGPACDVLNLLPADKAKPLGYRGANTSSASSSAGGPSPSPITSWGGSVVAGDDGLFHMYAAEIAGGCGMNVWLSNSRVIHATSTDPVNEPFVRQGVVADVFAHEPIAARAPTGEYVVWYTAVLPPGKLPVEGGRPCVGCHGGNSVASCGTDATRNASINLPT